MDRYGIGIDVGGTFTKLAAVSAGGRIFREIEIPSHAEHPPARFAKRVGSVIRLLESELGGRADGIGLGLAGEVDHERGVLRFAPNLPLWKGFRFKRAFESLTGRRVAVDNDANAAVWGAYVCELRRKPSGVLGVTLGTGVGGGLVIGGRLHHGATGGAGELGHTRVDWPGARCRCGMRGCLEAHAGSYGVIAAARAVLSSPAGRKSLMRKLCPDPARLDCRAVGLAAEKGDAAALRVWAGAGRHLATAMANAVLLLNPEVIILLGGLSRSGRFLIGPIRESLARRPFRTAFEAVSVRVARNPHWGSVGAALLALGA